ncbi:MAG: LuxR C-terminal-related transcriptional regulator [Clostridia bacterium]|nr:LuxR C-terminal-related transcriptional regulator [Clostridia bacterium]
MHRAIMKERDTFDYGTALYEPYSNILECNRIFSHLRQEVPLRQFIEEIMAAAPLSPQQEKPIVITRDGISFTIQARADSQDSTPPIYFIRARGNCTSEPVGTPLNPDFKPQYIRHGLTLREIDVIALLAAGLSNQEISDRLVISLSTVKTHVKNIFSKYGVNSRTELLRQLQEEA